MSDGFDRWRQAVQQMEPIVSTADSRDLRDAPDAVRARYDRHVALYVPLARAASTGEGPSVPALEKRLIDLIRRQQAPRGYVAAHYGHGKTSTGLFLWKRCVEADILAVPPFKLSDLTDLVTATHGWVRFVLGKERPQLVHRADEIRDEAAATDVAAFARRYGISAETARRMYDEGRVSLTLDGLQFVRFLDAMTNLAREAGFVGLLLIADEIQQFLGEAKAAWNAQLRSWFDLTEALRSRKGELACGMMYLIRTDELAAVSGDRDDLVQRLQESKVHLNLAEVYGDDFPAQFCRNVGGDSGYDQIAARVIDENALAGLGQIATRADLAAGPRTVVDVLRIAEQRFANGDDHALRPTELVEIFEHGQVTFDGLAKIQGAVRAALAFPTVTADPRLAEAVRLAAAFPTTGATREVARQYGLEANLQDLERLTAGDLVAVRGGGFDRDGHPLPEGTALIGLAPQGTVTTWLQDHVRRFRRQYFLTSERVRQDAARGFEDLLLRSFFPSPQWKVEKEFHRTDLSQNRALVLKGSFTSLVTRFPERVVYARILQDGESIRDVVPADVDLSITFVLEAGAATTEKETSRPGRIEWISDKEAILHLNLVHHTANTTYPNLSPGFENFVSPHDVTPLLLLSLHQSLRRAENQIPNAERPQVVNVFMPELLKTALPELANEDLGRELNAANARVVEEVFRRLCETAFPGYESLMTTGMWAEELRRYRLGIMGRDDPGERRGEKPIVGTKDDVARIFGKAAASLDAYCRNFDRFLKIERDWRRGVDGALRLTLHPLERWICEEVERNGQKMAIRTAARRIEEIPALDYEAIERAAKGIGYRPKEIEMAVELLEARQFVEWRRDQRKVLRVEPPVPDLAELVERFKRYRGRLDRLAAGIEPPDVIRQQEGIVAPWIKQLSGGDIPRSDLINADRTLATLERGLGEILRVSWDRLRVEAERLAGESGNLERPIAQIDRLVDEPGLFGSQLEAARVDLSEAQRAYLASAEQVRRGAEALHQQLGTEPLTDDRLLHASQGIQHARTEIAALRVTREQLRGQLSGFQEADRLLRESLGLIRRCGNDVALREPAEQVENWGTEIAASISGRRRAAFDDVTSWRSELDDVARAVSAREREIQEQFTHLQDRLLTVVRDRLRGGERASWRPLVFNPSDPDASIRALRDVFADALQAIAEPLEHASGDIGKRLQSIEKVPDLHNAAPDLRATIDGTRREARQKNQVARRGLDAWVTLARDVRDGGDLEGAADQIGNVAAEVFDALTQAIRLTQRLQKTIQDRISLTDDEARAYAALVKQWHARADAPDLDWEIVRTALGDPDTAGQLVARLAEKHRVRIHVEVFEE